MKWFVKFFLSLYLFLLGIYSHAYAHYSQRDSHKYTHQQSVQFVQPGSSKGNALLSIKPSQSGFKTHRAKFNTTDDDDEDDEEVAPVKRTTDYGPCISTYRHLYVSPNRYIDCYTNMALLSEQRFYSSIQRHIILRVIRI